MSKRFLTLVLGLALAVVMTYGQVTNARIVGTIADTDGNVLPGVAVEATSPGSSGRRRPSRTRTASSAFST